MKNILFISKFNTDKNTGVTKKISAQINAFKILGNTVSYLEINSGNIYNVNDKKSIIAKLRKNKILLNLQLLKEYIKLIKAPNNFDFVYIRKFFANPTYLRLLKLCKKKNIKILEEIPTYPYDSEIDNSKRFDLKISLYIDKIYRKFLKNYIDYVVTFSNDSKIYGVDTINIENGIDVDSIKPIDYKFDKKNINIIAVASMEYWQGYDRLINSLANYYLSNNVDKLNIKINLVGEGRSVHEWKKLAIDKNISDKVIFHGFLQGNDLDNLYDECQLAVATLGLSRKDMDNISTLKVKEYIAKAIPFIYATPENHIEECKYCYKVNDDETIFNMDDIVRFINNINTTNMKEDMRNLARKYFNWSTTMKYIMNKLYNE